MSHGYEESLEQVHDLPAHKGWPDPEEWYRLLLSASPPKVMVCRVCGGSGIFLTEHMVAVGKRLKHDVWVGRCKSCGRVFWSAKERWEEEKRPKAPEDMGITFGKYRGKTLGWLAEHDLRYLDWMRDADCTRKDPLLAKAIEAVARKYAREIDELSGDCGEG